MCHPISWTTKTHCQRDWLNNTINLGLHVSSTSHNFAAFRTVNCFFLRRSCLKQLYSVNAEAAEPRGFASEHDSTTLPRLPEIPDLEGKNVRSRWNPVHLAFLGDAVWELLVRNTFFSPPKRLKQYYEAVQAEVRAEAQAIYYEVLCSGKLLSEEEQDVLRWGHNAKVVAPKRFSGNGKHVDTYKRATAFECLMGYLYLTDLARLQQVFDSLL